MPTAMSFKMTVNPPHWALTSLFVQKPLSLFNFIYLNSVPTYTVAPRFPPSVCTWCSMPRGVHMSFALETQAPSF